MKKETLKIQVIDVQSGQQLYECSLADSHKAHEFAAKMEEIGLDVKVIVPTLSETLSSSLGLSSQEISDYKTSMEEEMEQHEGSCCFEDGKDPKQGPIH